MINFNIPPAIGTEPDYIRRAIENKKICGDGPLTKECSRLLESLTGSGKVLLTTSCTHALEMAAILCDIQPGDEVIMPSYTFVSTANAFVLRGATIVFVDIRPDTLNIDEKLIEAAITPKTKAIVPVHYAGVACEMDTISAIAQEYSLKVIEDAAQGVMSAYKGKALGAIGDFGCYSFHETKNYSMGEGGALLINAPEHFERAEIIREKGTNRSLFLRGQIDKYTWVDVGSSYLPSELNAAYLLPQLEAADKINQARLAAWNRYHKNLQPFREELELPYIPADCEHNAHMYYIKLRDLQTRTKLIEYLKNRGVHAVFHYVPLHSSQAGRRFGRFSGKDNFTASTGERLLRLPMYYGLADSDVDFVCGVIAEFAERTKA